MYMTATYAIRVSMYIYFYDTKSSGGKSLDNHFYDTKSSGGKSLDNQL